MKRFFLLCTGIAALTACEVASDDGRFLTANGARVYPVSADVFEVVARPNNEINQFWCGAGEYASQVLGAPPSARVYVVAEAGRGTVVDAPNAVQFSLRPLEQLDGVEGRKGTWGPRLDEDEFVSDARYRCSRNVLPFTF